MSHEIHRIAYAVSDPPPNASKETKARWAKVGVTFLNKDGSESVLLDALPVHGKLVLQTPRDESDTAEQ